MRQPKHYTFARAALMGSFWPLALIWEHGSFGDNQPAAKQHDSFVKRAQVEDEGVWCDEQAWRASNAEHEHATPRAPAAKSEAEEEAQGDAALPALKFSPRDFPAPNENRAARFHLEWPAMPAAAFEVLIYDLLGQPVRHLLRGNPADYHRTLVWDGKDDACRPAPPGKYWYRMKTEKRIYSKMLIIKR
jgi:hypothetical protein